MSLPRDLAVEPEPRLAPPPRRRRRAPRAPRALLAASGALAGLISGRAVADPDGASELRVAITLRGVGATLRAEERAALSRDLARRVSSEVGRPVVQVAASDCREACLEVVLSDATVTERFAAGADAPRERTIDVGGDPGLWLDAVALLAGNLVRDEAAALLPDVELGDAAAGDPPAALAPRDVRVAAESPLAPVAPAASIAAGAPAPAATSSSASASAAASSPAAPAAPAEAVALDAGEAPPRRRSYAALGFVPVLSSDGLSVGRVQHDISVDVLVGVSGGSRVFSASGLVDLELGRVEGVQLGGLATAARELRGVQVAGVVAFATDVRGAQLGGVAVAADVVRGTQVGGVLTVARGPSRVQVAGVAAATGADAHLQIAGVASVARGTAATQVAGVLNVADVAHTQVSGAVNVAKRVDGLQVGVVNVAGHTDGLQIGVVNVGGGRDGISLGLLNFVRGGRTDLEASLDSSSVGTLLLRHGSRRWHNVYGVGGQRPSDELVTANDDVWMYGLGFGPSWTTDETTLDLDAIAWQVNYGARHSDELSLLGQLRLSFAHALGPVTAVAGAAVNTFVSTDRRQPFLARRSAVPVQEDRADVTTKTWLSVFVGLRL
ncbi:MAG: hypothetical protein R3B48_28500 [Kofleriaceae bacterium]